jgi:hypothetical protein
MQLVQSLGPANALKIHFVHKISGLVMQKKNFGIHYSHE